MSRIFITIGSAYSKAANVNPVDGIWCSDCGWAGRVEEDMTDSEESEEPLFEVTVKGEKGWKAIHMCGSMADAVPVADAVHNLSYLLDTPIAIRVREKRGKGLEG